MVPASSQCGRRAARLVARAGSQRKDQRQKACGRAGRPGRRVTAAQVFPGSNARALRMGRRAHRRVTAAQVFPGSNAAGCRRWRLAVRPVLERPRVAVIDAVRGRGQNHDGQIAPHRLFNFTEAHLARQLIRINACILRNFHNKFGASGGPAQASGHVKYPEP